MSNGKRQDRKDTNPGILLLAFGGPDNLSSVEPFLRSILPDRAITPELIKRTKKRYEQIGGRSPILDITMQQARVLEDRLKKRYKGIKVYVGMRNWHPLIGDTIGRILRDGKDSIIVLIMAPHQSKASTGGYVEAVNLAVDRLEVKPEITFVESWHRHPLYLDGLSRKIGEAMSMFPLYKIKKPHIIFSAHSLPKRLVEGDPYVEQLKGTIKGVLERIGPITWDIAYQSKGKGPSEWLDPDIETVLQEAAKEKIKDILIVPLSFVADNLETLYDIDILLKKKAEDLGINMIRTPTLNDSPHLIDTIYDVLVAYLKRGVRCRES